ncbi:MAG TPA: aminotransferase class I/II-fold pyridoxal phosphate-dependent enzyme [Clostridiales bacterium]|nr:aminotransferase class I/II-fold pyridoxal phosphate-dependent enzyme [Clostridiales bacterium]
MDFTSRINPVVAGMKPSGIRRFFDIAFTMENVVSLGIGEPDFVTPWHIRDAGIYSLEKGNTMYTPNPGLPELRKAIARYQQRRFDLHYDPEEVLVTVGGSEAIDLAIRAFVTPGDEVIIPEPCFVCYGPIVRLAGGVPVALPTMSEDSFRINPTRLKAAITEKTKILIVPFPNNPTGAVMRKEHLEEVAKICVAHDLIVVSDEIYGELTFGNQRHVSISSLPGMRERTIIVSGLSKSHAMTGWRIGYALAPKEAIAPMNKVHQYAIMCAPIMSQYAAIEAIENGDDDIAMMAEEYDRRRMMITDELNRMGLPCFEPEGAFYVFPDIRSTGLSSEKFCESLLYAERVAVVPGDAFGASGEGFVRCSYAYSVQNITIAMERIKRFLDTL